MGNISQKYKLSFLWSKNPHGYKWENSRPCSPWGELFDEMDAEERKKHDDVIPFSPEGPFLVPNIPGGAKVPFEPLANSLLFAQFSDMAPTGESFLGWANTYGRLIDIET